jgi:hypothetical protein
MLCFWYRRNLCLEKVSIFLSFSFTSHRLIVLDAALEPSRLVTVLAHLTSNAAQVPNVQPHLEAGLAFKHPNALGKLMLVIALVPLIYNAVLLEPLPPPPAPIPAPRRRPPLGLLAKMVLTC